MAIDIKNLFDEYGLYVTENDVSKIINRSKGTLRNDRCYNRGIPYIKFGGGRAVRYALQDVIDYMESHKITAIIKE